MALSDQERLEHIKSCIEDARAHNGLYSSNHSELEWLIAKAEQTSEGSHSKFSATLTVQELIDALMKVEDKERGITVNVGEKFTYNPTVLDMGSGNVIIGD